MMPWPLCGQASEGLAKDISPKVPEIACGLRTTWWVMKSPMIALTREEISDMI